LSKNRTIIAPATVPGRGGIAIVRMSGELSKNIAEGMCGELAEAWRFKRCSIKTRGGSKIDDGMVVFFKSPNSYTGDDVVELHCHGNPTIVNLVIEEAVNRGAVVAEPGEFTKTAFLNEKIDLVQAESVADLINAQSETAVIAANSSLSGQFSEQINLLLDGIVKARVVVEANIDFPEEEIDDSVLETVKEELQGFHAQISELVSRVKEGVKLRDGYSVAIVGPPNAGKSSLLNLLAREDLAITSEVPGTTRDLVKASVNIGGVLIEFVDTAGVRPNPEGPIEEEGIQRSKEVIKKSNLSLLVQDATAVQGFDVGLGDSLTVLNKSDLLEGEFSNVDSTFYLSCATGQGVEELLKGLIARLGIDGGEETVFMSRQRHEVSLRSGGLFLEEAIMSLGEGEVLELVAESLRSAHAALGDILRPMSADDLLGEIFSEFCIGK
jgi:tRNA modification GTPase